MIKTFFKGLLYVILSPLILVGFALYAVYALLLYFWEFLVASYKFFTGSKLTTETKEDRKVKQLVIEKNKKLEAEQKPNENSNVSNQVPPSNTTINNFYITKDQLPPQMLGNQTPNNSESNKVKEIDMTNGGESND